MLLTGGIISRLQPAGHGTTKRKSWLICLRIADELLDVLAHRDFRDVKYLPTLKIVVFPFSPWLLGIWPQPLLAEEARQRR